MTLGDITPGPGAKYTNTTNVTASSAPDPAALLDELAALREAATTPGEWHTYRSMWMHPNDLHVAANDEHDVARDVVAVDAALIVAAVNALPGLVGAVRAVLDHLNRWQAFCGDCRQGYPDEHADLFAAVTAALAEEPQP